MTTTPQTKSERRLHVRHKVRTRVHIRSIGTNATKMCRATNLGANGVAILTEDMSLKIGCLCILSFAIDLGEIVKIYKRLARVVHVHNGITGFIMESI